MPILLGNHGQFANSQKAIAAPPFSAQAVMLTSGVSYTIPNGATTMKAWVVGGGGKNLAGTYGAAGAGGCAFKTWSVSGGQSITYSVAPETINNGNGGDTTLTFSGTTITGFGGARVVTGGSFSGGDGGASGGNGVPSGGTGTGGAVGGNGTVATCGRRRMTDVSGLIAALALAGVSTTENCGINTPAFGSGAYASKYGTVPPTLEGFLKPGLGGGGAGTFVGSSNGGGGAVVLYFT